MNIKWQSEIGASSHNSYYVFENSTKAFETGLPDSASGSTSNIPFMQASMSREWIHGTPNGSIHIYPQEVASNGLLRSTQAQEFYRSDDYHLNDGSVQTDPLDVHGSVQIQRPAHEASSYSIGHSFYSSPSIQSCSSGGSTASPQTSQTYPSDIHYYHSPGETHGPAGSGYSSTEQDTGLKYMIQELETALLGPDSDDPDTYEENKSSEFSEWNLKNMCDTNDSYCQSSLSVYTKAEPVDISVPTQNNVKEEIMNEEDLETFCSMGNISNEQQQPTEDDIPHGDVRKLLIACAKAIDEDDSININKMIAELRQVVSVCGDPMQRLGAYLLEGLIARLASSGSAIYKALRCKQPASADLLSYMHILYEVCPYFKFGYMAANGAIAEAFKDEDRVHIIDFQIAQGSQWVTLLQALASRPGGPPCIRVTGVDDPVSEYARGGGLDLVGKRLSKLAETCNVPFEFHAVPVMGSDVQVNMLEVWPREALAVNFAFQLHHLPDESVNTSNHRDRIIRMIKGLRPKVVTLVEQEANTNTAPFFPRFMETLSYYSAMFESIDVTLPRDSKERISVEQHCLARDIVNIIACEGEERIERHELMGKWRCRFSMAGFRPYPLSLIVNSTIKLLLEDYCERYSLFERDDTLYLGWSKRTLVAATAWQ